MAARSGTSRRGPEDADAQRQAEQEPERSDAAGWRRDGRAEDVGMIVAPRRGIGRDVAVPQAGAAGGKVRSGRGQSVQETVTTGDVRIDRDGAAAQHGTGRAALIIHRLAPVPSARRDRESLESSQV